MTHENAGHYAKKHPADRKVKKEIVQAVKQKASDGEISCSAAHKIATSLDVPAEEVGFVIDYFEIRIVKCQLGLYGYRPEKKVVEPAKAVPKTLEEAIKGSLMIEGPQTVFGSTFCAFWYKIHPTDCNYSISW